MTTSQYDTTAATGGSTAGDQSVKDKAADTAGTARDEAADVASVARDEAGNVAAEARDQARTLIDEATSQVEEQSREQTRRLAGTVRTFGDDVQSMAEGTQGGLAADVARQVADRARTLASQLEDREPRELLEDVKGFARRKPGTFLLGALAAGVVAGRLTRGTRDARSGSSGGTTTPQPLYDAQRTQPVPTVEPQLPGDHIGTTSGTVGGVGTPPGGTTLPGEGDPLITDRDPGEPL